MATRPDDSGVSSRWFVSAPRTISARRASAGSDLASPYLRTIASKLHSSPWCPSSASGMSYGVAPSRSATDNTWSFGAYKNWALGSTKRMISHGHAMRSTFGRSRVTHFMRRLLPVHAVCHSYELCASNSRHTRGVNAGVSMHLFRRAALGTPDEQEQVGDARQGSSDDQR